MAPLHQLEAHPGVQHAELAQQLRHGGAAQGVQEPEGHAAAVGARLPRDGTQSRLELVQGPLGVHEQQTSLRRQPQRAAGPHEQRQAEVALQAGEAAAQRRLGHAERLRRPRDVLGPPDGDEVPQSGREVRQPRPHLVMHVRHGSAC